jgi:hypothetical protein
MKDEIIKILKYILQIVLTALASAGIAILQQYIQSKGVHAGPTLDISNTGEVGATVASAKIVWSQVRSNLIS